MPEDIPLWLDALFLVTTAVTIILFYRAHHNDKGLVTVVLLWSTLHAVLAWLGVYEDTKALPPPFALVIAGITLLILYGLFSAAGKRLRQHRDRVAGTALHTIRVPVEITLYYLYLYGAVPELMTFSGRNFDILAGLTAPVIAWLIWKHKASRPLLIGWNLVCLGLVCFILANGILSAELPIQQFGFDQPNRAVLYFPYILLPAVVVPIVIFSHLSDLITYFKMADL